MFIARINEPLVQNLGHDFFVIHDCIHWFTGLGVSVEEERLINDIQKYMIDNKPCTPEAEIYLLKLKDLGVYEELKTALCESKASLTR
jgi:hypothetical protein